MKRVISAFALFLIISIPSIANGGWVQKEPFNQKVFIENVGQFPRLLNFLDNHIEYYATVDGMQVYFTKEGLTYRYDEIRKEKEEGLKTIEMDGEESEHAVNILPHFMHIDWLGANANVEIITEEVVSYYFTYGSFEVELSNKKYKAKAYKKITYKNLYPNIDVEYIFPENKKGIKYNIILHPGADASLIKMKYSDRTKVKLNETGDIEMETYFGKIVDYAPQTFYENARGTSIKSEFILQNGLVTFKLENYDNTKTTIIDPWTTVPNFSGYDAGYDVEYDLAGNVYAHGGDGQWGSTPYQIIKFNSSGTIQWVFDLITTPMWSFMGTDYYAYTDFAVDINSGSSFVGEGYRQGFGARMFKVDNAGNQVTLFTGEPRIEEIWKMEYDNLNKKLILGCGGVTNGNNYQIASIDTNLTTMLPVNAFSATTPLHDVCIFTLDNCGNYFAALAKSYVHPNALNNSMIKGPTSTLIPRAYMVGNGYQFSETRSVSYVNGNMGQFAPVKSNTNSFNGLAANNLNLFSYDGSTVKKWNKATGAAQGNVNLTPADTFKWGGISADDCGNIYIGQQNSIGRLDNNLNTVATIATPDEVYDVLLAPGNIVLACGKGFVGSFNAVACTVPNSPITVNITLGGPCNAPTATAAPSGGTPNYSYSWSPSGGSAATTGALTPGTYTVTVSDVACNSKTATVTVAASSINAPTSSTPSLCTSANGTATVTPSGGTPNYSYSWTSGDTTATATGLAPGTYTVTVTDNGGCSQTATVTVSAANGGLTVSATNTPALCTASNGTATATPASGTPNYSYVWSPSGGTAATASGLAAGTYTVVVTDGNGCTATTTTTVGTSPGALTASATTTPALCTAANGTATATPASGSPNYSYAWTPSGGTAATASGLAPGTYTVLVTDGNGCTATTTATVGQSSGTLTASATSTPALCTALNGTATATPAGGTPNYSYAWTPTGGTGATANALAPGTYTVSITDGSGCTTTATTTVGQSSGTLTASATATPSLCVANNGTATATPTGGTAGYTYAWSPSGGAGATASNLAPGTYTVSVTDASGCVTTASAIVTQSSGTLAATVAATPALCGANNGTATATVTGGTAAYTYAWSPSGGTASTANGLAGGTYTVTVTDASGCVQTQTVVVAAPPAPTAILNPSPSVTINIFDSLTLAASGGGTYSWNPTTGLSCTNCANPIAKPIESTTYCVTVTDNNNCTSSKCVTINVEVPCPTNESLAVPNAFSPNRDGVNDEFCLQGWDACLEDFQIVIYNRWGEKVFESVDPNFCWDGKYLSSIMDAQVFVYYIKARYITLDKPIVKKGNISLLR